MFAVGKQFTYETLFRILFLALLVSGTSCKNATNAPVLTILRWVDAPNWVNNKKFATKVS